MKLKKVKIFGFKTFADKTEIELEGQIAAVVGPNGCGKSNIVDSILWGLGETNARHLRAQTGQEVIFSGSSQRKPVGYAEVSLLFDNEDGALPIDSPEVMISRRLTRGGDANFSINRRNCRLRDVADLLADSGLGRAGYAIVGQSEIDQALAASPVQRRAWIDEAAGVQRYRARRQEAVRRLQSADEHLQRVFDILTELESQREPLQAEAEEAKKYRIAAQSLRELEVGLLIKEVRDAIESLKNLEITAEQLSSASAELDDTTAKLIEESAQLQEKLGQMEGRIEQIRDARQRAQIEFEQTQTSIRTAESRLEGLDELKSSLEEEAISSRLRFEEAQRDLAAAVKDHEGATTALEALRESLGAHDSESKELTERLKAVENELTAAKEQVAQQQKMEVEAAHRIERRENIQEEIQGIDDSMPDLTEAIAEAQKQESGVASQVTEREEKVAKLNQGLKEIDTEAERLRRESHQVLEELAALEGRRRGILHTLEAHEGLAHGSKAVMAAAEQGQLDSDYTPVAEAITVDKEHAVAIEAALGGAAGDLIVPDERAAKEAIQLLKQNRLGRATFQPITLMRRLVMSDELISVTRQPGVIGLAHELVECQPEHRPVIESLLGRVVVCEDLDAALKLGRTRGWSRMVTLDGELVYSSGAVTGGTSKNQHYGVVQRKSELKEIEGRIRDLQRTADQSGKADETRDQRRQALIDEIESLKGEIAGFQPDLKEAQQWLMSLQHEMQAAEKSREKLQSELEKLTEIDAVPMEKVETGPLEKERDELLQKLGAKGSSSQQMRHRLEELTQRHAEAETRRRELEKRMAHLTESRESRAKRLENIEPDRESLTEQQKQARVRATELEQAIKDREEELELAQEARTHMQEDLKRIRTEQQEIHGRAKTLSDRAHETEIKRARADGKRATSAQRLLEEYGMTEDDAVAAPEPDVPDDAPGVVARLRREIRSMGEVNLGAIEAYDRLTQRVDELGHQAEDIEKGKAEIQSSMKELDRLTESRFRETFDKLQVSFREMFEKIFAGGSAELELTEPDQLLDSGVEIHVTLPGKRAQRLALLSGGERALSALAFLFALLKIKPSPLVILDEVDAPLDGRNVERFVAMMKEFLGQTQFIVVTHNAVTMEAADVWFGVTMQEPGVSTLVPFRVPSQEVSKAVVPDAYLKG